MRTTLLAAVLAVVAGRANAQSPPYAPELLAVAARDPGAGVAAPTARSIGLGGVHLVTGSAEDAWWNPAGLVFGAQTDVVIAAGPSWYSRTEPSTTPSREFGDTDPTTGFASSSPDVAAVSFAAVAIRERRWGFGAFFDASTRYEHAFETAQALVGQLPGTGVFDGEQLYAAGQARVAQSVNRFGGSVALASTNRRVSVGGAALLAHATYSAGATLSGPYQASGRFPNGAGGMAIDPRGVVSEDAQIDADGWNLGWVLSIAAKPAQSTTLYGRWQHDPSVDYTMRDVVTMSGPRIDLIPAGFTSSGQLQLPTSWSAGLTIVGHGTTFASELTHTTYSQFFPSADLAGFQASDAYEVRTGVEQRVATDAGAVLIRGGFAVGQGYTATAPI